MHIAAGDVLASRYRADALLGRGGMGEVWRAFDLEEKRDVAVKTVLAEHLTNPDVRRLFQAEVIAVARLSHPGIVEVYDLLHTSDGGSLLVMEYRAGQALDQALLSKPSWSLVRAIFVQLLEAVAHAHARSVLHLDLKPANVLVEKHGDGVRATLVDFGIARVKRPGRGAEKWFDSGVLVGTLEYMAPEQCRGQLERFGPWTDLYALGMMAYELCTGELPFPVYDPQQSMRRRLSEPAPLLLPLLNSVPPEFPELCARLLAIEPRDRPECAADVLAELERIDPHDAQRSDLRGLRSDPPAESQRLGEGTAPTLAARDTDAPTLLAHRRIDAILAELDREQQAIDAIPSTLSMPPSSSHRSGAEEAFNAEAAAPTPGAYGLFGLRELPVLGRVHERRAVWSAVGATALERRPGAVMLIGPAGTGKSRLARDAVERALELGLCNVLHTHWSASGSADEGLRGMIENALESRGYRGTEFDDRLSFWLERIPGEQALGREVRVLLRPEQDAAPDAALPIRVCVEAAARCAVMRPVLLWLDDVQWSRGEAAALIRALAERKPVPAICIVVTVREEEAIDSELEALVEALEAWCSAGDEEDHTELVRLPMRPLGREAARVLIRGLLYLDRELTDVIVARAEGNPLFATQLVRQLVVERALVRRGRRYSLAHHLDAGGVLPADIGAVWTRRIALSGANEGDLRALAIVRDRVSIEVADALASQAGSTFGESLERALAADLLQLDGELYAWTHGLLRDYLIRDLAGDEATKLHGWAADALAPLVGREDVQEERAMHLANAHRHREACEAMLDAALWCWRRAERDARQRRAEVLRAWSAAAGYPDFEARALAELGHLHAEVGNFDQANDAIEAARTKLGENPADPATGAWTFLRCGQTWSLQGRRSEGADACREAVAFAKLAGEHEVEATSCMQLGLDAYRRGDNAAARPLFDDATRMARKAQNRATEALALLQRSALETASVKEPLLRTAIRMSNLAGALRIELMARQLWADALWCTGKKPQALEEANAVSAEAARRSLRQTVSIVELQAACWAVEEGAWDIAAEHRRVAGEWGAASGAVPERAFAAALDVVLALARKDHQAAADAVEKLQCEAKGYDERTFRELVAKAMELAPPDIAERLSRM